MKDTDGLNDILGYARLVEGNQYSKHLSKVYLESVKTSNKDIEAIDKKNNDKNKKFQGGSKQQQNSKYRSQSRDKKGCGNCGSKYPPKCCPAFGKECYHCKKKKHFSNMCRSRQHSQSSNGHRPQSQNSRFSRKDHHELEFKNSKYRSQSRDKKGCGNCGSKYPPKCCPAFGKECYHCKKKKHFSNMCRSRQHSQSSNGHRPQSQNSRFSRKDHHELESQSQYNESKWYSYGQESVHIQFTTKHLYHTKQINVVFDETDNENMPRVLADLNVSQCNGPGDSLVTHVLCLY